MQMTLDLLFEVVVVAVDYNSAVVLASLIHIVIVATYTVFQKSHPFYVCTNLVKYYQISIIFGRSIPEEICNKNMHAYPRHLFTVLILYLVKIMIHLPMFTLF